MKFDEMMKLCKKKNGYHDDEEHRIQSSCVRWFRIAHKDFAKSLWAIPNGGFRSKLTAIKLKEEGVLSGVADLMLTEVNKYYGALFIEMKTAKGRQSDNQKAFEQWIASRGYKYVVCRSLDDFKFEIDNYLKDK